MSSRKVITSGAAPRAIGPYSQAIKAGSLLFLSGQVSLDAKTGDMSGVDITSQTRGAIENLRAVLAAAGVTLADVVKTTVFLKDMEQFAEMNRVYAEYFPSDPPARSTVEVARLPRNAMVEIEAIAALKD